MEENPNKPSEETVKIAERFLFGDLMKFMVQEIRQLPMGWQVLPEKQQKEVLDRMEGRTDEAVRRVVQIIAANDRPHILATLDSVTFKDGISMKLDISKLAANRHELADAQGGVVMIVLPKVDDHFGGDRPKPQADQPPLPGTEGTRTAA